MAARFSDLSPASRVIRCALRIRGEPVASGMGAVVLSRSAPLPM